MTTLHSLLAAAMKSRAAYDAIAASEEAEHFPGLLAPVWAAVRSYYDRDPSAQAADPVLIASEAARSSTSPKTVEAMRDLTLQIAGTEVSLPNIQRHIAATAAERVGHALVTAIATKQPREEVSSLMEQYAALGADADGASDDAMPWEGLLQARVANAARLKVSPAVLNERLGGGVLPGHNIVLFGRPESGKSALALSMACGFARRGVRVLYVGNEDPIQDLMVRAVQCLTARSIEQLRDDPDGSMEEALSKGAGNLFFRELAPGSLAEIERLVRLHKPGVLVVDQLRNIRAAKTDNFTQLLDRVVQGVRALGKKYKLVTICVTQAGESARDKPYLDDGDIDSSNTGIPGGADVLIGIGSTPDLRAAGLRMLSICKNKITGRHDNVQVKINPFISRVTS